MAKQPAFQFYPGDWMKDPDLRVCSHFARGLLVDLLCAMFEAKHRGLLCKADGVTPWTDEQVVGLSSGGDVGQKLDALRELESNGVLKRNGTGVLYSARMIRDEEIRVVRRQSASKGGSKTQANQQANRQAKVNSSSSSSSSSSLLNTHTHAAPTIEQLKEAGIPPQFLEPEGMAAIQKWHAHCASYHKHKGVIQIQAEIATAIQHGWSPAKWMASIVFSIAKNAINICDPEDDWNKRPKSGRTRKSTDI